MKTLSSDEKSMVKFLNVKKSKIAWPRIIVIGSTDEGDLRKLQGLAGSLKPVKKLRNGNILVKCANDSRFRSQQNGK